MFGFGFDGGSSFGFGGISNDVPPISQTQAEVLSESEGRRARVGGPGLLFTKVSHLIAMGEKQGHYNSEMDEPSLLKGQYEFSVVVGFLTELAELERGQFSGTFTDFCGSIPFSCWEPSDRVSALIWARALRQAQIAKGTAPVKAVKLVGNMSDGKFTAVRVVEASVEEYSYWHPLVSCLGSVWDSELGSKKEPRESLKRLSEENSNPSNTRNIPPLQVSRPAKTDYYDGKPIDVGNDEGIKAAVGNNRISLVVYKFVSDCISPLGVSLRILQKELSPYYSGSRLKAEVDRLCDEEILFNTTNDNYALVSGL